MVLVEVVVVKLEVVMELKKVVEVMMDGEVVIEVVLEVSFEGVDGDGGRDSGEGCGESESGTDGDGGV